MDFEPEYVRFIIKDAKKMKRTAIQAKEVIPIFTQMDNIAGKSTGLLTVGFEPFTLPKNQQLIIQVGETNDGRILELPVKSKTVLKARRL